MRTRRRLVPKTRSTQVRCIPAFSKNGKERYSVKFISHLTLREDNEAFKYQTFLNNFPSALYTNELANESSNHYLSFRKLILNPQFFLKSTRVPITFHVYTSESRKLRG